MKRFSIKQLVIVFLVGSVLLTGAMFFTMDSSDFAKGHRERISQERMVDCDCSDEEIEECMEKDGFQRGLGNRKFR